MMRQGIRSLIVRVGDLLRKNNYRAALPSSPPATRSSAAPLAIVGLVTSDDDRRLLASVCTHNGWYLLFADTGEEGRAALDKLKAPVILCDRDLPGKDWRETVEGLASSPHQPCIILVSGVVDTYLWDEVIRTGGYDVLPKPLREDDVARTVRLAWSYWNSTPANTRHSGKGQFRKKE